jgi:outer membrane biosynthesis protein TonB
MFKNLFGKKNDGFFMQVDESKPAAAKVESQKPEQKVADAAPVVETPSAVPSAAAPAAVVETPEPTKAAKTSVKDKKKQEKAAKKDEKVAQSPEKVTTAAAVAAPAQVFTNFATDYLIQPSSNGGRRRPGANMKNFVNMAREVKVKK